MRSPPSCSTRWERVRWRGRSALTRGWNASVRLSSGARGTPRLVRSGRGRRRHDRGCRWVVGVRGAEHLDRYACMSQAARAEPGSKPRGPGGDRQLAPRAAHALTHADRCPRTITPLVRSKLAVGLLPVDCMLEAASPADHRSAMGVRLYPRELGSQSGTVTPTGRVGQPPALGLDVPSFSRSRWRCRDRHRRVQLGRCGVQTP